MNKTKGGMMYWILKHAHKIHQENVPTEEELMDELFGDMPQRFLPTPKTEQELLRENIDREWKW